MLKWVNHNSIIEIPSQYYTPLCVLIITLITLLLAFC